MPDKTPALSLVIGAVLGAGFKGVFRSAQDTIEGLGKMAGKLSLGKQLSGEIVELETKPAAERSAGYRGGGVVGAAPVGNRAGKGDAGRRLDCVYAEPLGEQESSQQQEEQDDQVDHDKDQDTAPFKETANKIAHGGSLAWPT